jgi:superfamily II DNA/RNA helicase
MMASSMKAVSVSSIFFGAALLSFDTTTKLTTCSAYVLPPTKDASSASASAFHRHPAFLVGRRFEKAKASSHIFQSGSNGNSDSGAGAGAELKSFGLNELQTLLREAVVKEEYLDAASFSDELFERLYGGDSENDVANGAMSPEEKKAKRRRMSWRGQGAAPWLVDRLDALNYTLPTTIQVNTMEAVNQILSEKSNDNENENDGDFDDEYDEDERSMEERIKETGKDMGIVVSGSTGSGKTLAFLVPLLSTLSDSLFARQRIRIGAEESVGDFGGDLVSRISVVTSPVVQSNAKRPLRAGTIAIGASNPNPSLGKSGAKAVTDVKSPLALVVVPTRELGIQTAMLLYELVGGSIKKDPNEIRKKANMFKYKGPKGIRVGCILDDEEAAFGLKLQTDVAIVMPQYVGKLIADSDLKPSLLRVIAFDEADLALEMISPEILTTLFNTKSRALSAKGDGEDDGDYVPYEDRSLQQRLTFMVGASVTESLGNLVVKSRILPEGKSYIATATRHHKIEGQSTDSDGSGDVDANLAAGDQTKKASLKDLDVCLDPGLKHKRVLVGNETTGMLVLTRLLRKELEDYEKQNKNNNGPPPRVVIFFPDEAVAKASIAPLRDALWGEHKLCVLLPKTGVNPLQMMEQFKNNETTVMLATPNSVRGLDFPQVTHVYTLYLPTEDPREYVHLAGRVGRVGQTGSVRGTGGQVFSILKSEDASKMESMATELGFEFTDVAPIGAEVLRFMIQNDDDEGDDDEEEEMLDAKDLDKMRRFLEDTVSLVSSEGEEEESTGDSFVIDTTGVQFDDEDEDEYPGFQ